MCVNRLKCAFLLCQKGLSVTQLTRLNKYISETGFCSRREADKLIEAGRVKVNGNLPEMGLKVSDNDVILIDNKPLKAKPKRVYIAYNKPVGVTCTTERKIRSNIVSAINYPERIFPIGRLDRPSEGLIFLTNEGDIVNKILRAGNNHEKEYVVGVDRPINKRFIERMAGGLPILDTVTKKCFVEQTGERTFTIVLTQGLNRQIRRMCEYLGYEVTTLKRVRIMNVNLNGLRPGQWRHLTEAEMREINDSISDSAKTEEGSIDPNKRLDSNSKPRKAANSNKPPREKGRIQRTENKPVGKPSSGPKRKSGTLSLKK
nr:23S rRNA pseudouridine(2604) synthase RluF [Pseudoalteromonas sp. MMG022]